MLFANNKVVVSFLFIFCLSFVFSQQKNSDKLIQQQKQLEKDIKQTKELLKKTSSNKQATLNNLSVLENQLKSREALLQNFDQQIRSTELQMEQKSGQITSLEEKIKKLKEQYRQLLIYVYKNKLDGNNKLMYLFSAHSYYEAFKRNEYLQKIAEIQKKQRDLILQHQEKLGVEVKSLADEKVKKQLLLGQKKEERNEIEKDKLKVQEVVSQLEKEESVLASKVRENERKKVELQNRINEAIRKEIEAEERKRKEAERIAAAKEAAKSKTSTTKTTETTVETKTEPKTSPTFSASKDLALDRSFESNKGKLPLPVISGAITGNFGKQAHPFLKNVVTNNNGIDITTSKHAQVRAIFEGEVTSIFSIPGIGKIVIVKHGNYRSVYSNLQETFVSIGAKVSTKQPIGSLLLVDGETTSILHFEIHQVVNSTVVKQNPSLWIAR